MIELLTLVIVAIAVVYNIKKQEKASAPRKKAAPSASPNVPKHRAAVPERPASAPLNGSAMPKQSQDSFHDSSVQTGVSMSYQRPASTGVGIHYEEWMTIPEGYRVTPCRYCGALNAVSSREGKKPACYFCRELL